MPNPPAVILGGAVTALSLTRSLAAAGVSVYVLDRRDSPARASRHCTEFVDVGREEMQARMLEWLRTGPRGAVLLAGSDEGLELVARRREELTALGYLPMEADDQVLLAMLDKERTAELAREHGIPVPGTTPLRSREDVEAACASITFPCVLKPLQSHVFARRTLTGAKVVIASDARELHALFEEMSALGAELAIIEVVSDDGDEYSSFYSYIDEHGRPLLSLTKRKLRQLPPRFGIGTYHVTTHDPEVAEIGMRFFAAVGLRGLGNVEFKRDGGSGELKLIECNARFTMASELIRAAGVDLALFAYNRILGRPTPPVDTFRAGLHLWDPVNDARAFLGYRREGELSLAAWVSSLLARQQLFTARLEDPLPALFRASGMLARASAKRRGGETAAGFSRVDALPEHAAAIRCRVRELRARVERSRAPDAAPPPHNASPDPGASAGTVQLGTLYGRVWREAAEETGASIEELAPEVFELRRGDRAIRVWRDVVDVDDPVTLALARDLALARRLLLRADVPVPDHLEFSARDPKPALEFLSAGGPCTIGPSLRRDGERGSTSGIETAAQLRRASREAATQTERLLIEREAPGELYRLLLLDGELIDALRISRHADGAGAGRDAACGPLAPELVAQAGAAQRTVGVRLAGVEVITSDPSRSPAETGAVVFDVRGNPPLHEHHPAPPHPGSSPVLVSLVGRLLPASARGDDDVPLASSGAATSNGAGWRALLPQSPHTE